MLSAGTLDPTFSTDGVVTTNFVEDDFGRGVAVQDDGKTVVVGYTENADGNLDIAVARYNTDGTLDDTFGTGGKVITDFGGRQDVGGDVTTDSSGRIVVVGASSDPESVGIGRDFAVVRYDGQGNLDSTFGTDGTVRTDIAGGSDFAHSVVVDSRDRILVAGESAQETTGEDFALVAYNDNGELETSFGKDGTVTADFSNRADNARDMVLDVDGRIVLAGNSIDLDTLASDFALVRYTADGELDTSFGGTGQVRTDFGNDEDATGVGIDSKGRIVAAGSFDDPIGGGEEDIDADFALARYTSDGELDSSFGIDGKVLTDFFGNDDTGLDVAVDSSDRVLMAGWTITDDGFHDFALARYLSTGELDTGFNSTGKVVTNLAGDANTSIDRGIAIALDSAQRILVAGNSDFDFDGDTDTAVARYLGDPLLSIDITADSIAENDGAGATTATVMRSNVDDLGSDLVVDLSSSDTTEATVPATVTIAAEEASATFEIDAVDDALLDGTQTATITASAAGYVDGSDTLDVLDHETLELSFDRDSIAVGESTTATATRSNTDVDDPLPVTLVHTDSSEFGLPETVEIPAGQQSVSFTVLTSDNGIVEGVRAVVARVDWTSGYVSLNTEIELREEGVVGAPVTVDGFAEDSNLDGVFDSVNTTLPEVRTRFSPSLNLEQRGLFEFDISGLDGSRSIEDASLTVRVDGTSIPTDVDTLTVEIFGYSGDGIISLDDASLGTKVGELGPVR